MDLHTFASHLHDAQPVKAGPPLPWSLVLAGLPCAVLGEEDSGWPPPGLGSWLQSPAPHGRTFSKLPYVSLGSGRGFCMCSHRLGLDGNLGVHCAP